LARTCAPRLLVMMITVFVKSTLRPWLSVKTPSSSSYTQVRARQ
jgi:hypothetical protein